MTQRSTADDPVVVIGSGPCGAAAAHQLVAKGIDVLMLDAGTTAPSGWIVRAFGNTLYRKYGWEQYSADRHVDDTDSTDWYSSLSLGGLSNYWTAAVPRFAPDDFTDGGRIDKRYVWPVSYDDLETSYAAAEQLLTVTTGGDILGVPSNQASHRHRLPSDWSQLAEAVAANGEGLGALPMAKGTPWMVARRGTEFSSFHCVVQPMLSAPNFELRRGAHATRINWSAARSCAESVEYVDVSTGAVVTIPTRAVVLAAGTIDSTMILLRSRSADFPTGLGNSAGLIGRYLSDHPRQWWSAELERPMRALSHPMYLARRPHELSDPLMATSHTIGLVAPKDRLRTYVGLSMTSIGVQVFGTQVPQDDIGVSLDDPAPSDPVHQRPRISLRYDDAAAANVASGRQRLCDVFADAGLPVTVTSPEHDLRPGSSVHYAGTVRMHADPRHGVLDEFARMHDVSNVAVCDMSAFTTNPEKNPTLTAMALAIRAADRLAADVA